jgi:hypothetical protein
MRFTVRRQPLRAIAAVAAVLLAASAWAPLALGASPAPAASPVVQVGGPTTQSPAADLRVNLDRLLAEHVFLTIEEMRSGLLSSPDYDASARAVEGNSTDVVAAMGSVYGASAVGPFGDVWRSHIGYLVDYSKALGANDQAAEQQALDGLATYRANLRALLTQVNPGVDLGAILAAFDTHTAQLVEFVTAEHAGDHARAYAIEREAYPHMFMIGDDLAKVIANELPTRFTGLDRAYSGAGTLRVTLDQLLGEHMFLAAEALRAGLSGAPYFDASKAALDANSTAVADLVRAAFGDAAANQFLVLWRAHITAYLAYIDAAKANDATAEASAAQQIDVAAAQIAGFLSAAIPSLDATALSQALQEHAGHLLRQVDAYAAGDYDGAYGLVREGYQHMFMIGETLAAGVAAELPQKFPAAANPPNTATLPPGTRPNPVLLAVAVAAGSLLVVAAALAAWSLGPRLRRGPRGSGQGS